MSVLYTRLLLTAYKHGRITASKSKNALTNTLETSITMVQIGPETTVPPIDLSLQRMREGYQRGESSDTDLWLSFCGGGMAAAHNVGKALAARELGLNEVVDGVCGDSAGAFIGATFVSGQLEYTETAFADHLPAAGLIDFKRALRWKRILNLGVLEQLINESLDAEAILDPDTPEFGFAYTNLRKQQPVFVFSSEREDPAELRKELLWGAHMPLVAGIPPRNADRDPVADAGLSLKATWEIAAAGGATHVIEGSTSVFHCWEPSPVKTFGVGLWMQVFGNKNGIWRYNRFANEQISLQNGPLPPNVQVVYPTSGTRLAPTLTRDSRLVQKTIDAGFDSMMAAFGYETSTVETPRTARENLIHYMGRGATAKTFALAIN